MGCDAPAAPSRAAILKYIVLVAGSIRSGKTAVARATADLLGAGYTSFGAEVRDRAAQQGLNPKDRTVLQEIGEDLVENNLREFLDAVIRRITPSAAQSQYVVFDGLRHVRVVDAVNERMVDGTAVVVYVDAPNDARHMRSRSEGVDAEGACRADAHSNEAESSTLRDIAVLRLVGDDDVSSNAQRVVAYLQSLP